VGRCYRCLDLIRANAMLPRTWSMISSVYPQCIMIAAHACVSSMSQSTGRFLNSQVQWGGFQSPPFSDANGPLGSRRNKNQELLH
jgi:hypothetical protein